MFNPEDCIDKQEGIDWHIIKYQNYKFLNNCLAVQNIMRNFAPEING